MRIIKEGLAYDDVLILPRQSNVLPHETVLTSQFTRNLQLKTPLVSAAMDTVTEAATAIAMARLGGIGIIHKNLSVDEQALEVRKVKKSESGMVVDPITVTPDDSVAHIHEVMSKHGISGLPVVHAGELVGIVTGRDIRFEKNLQKKVSDVMRKNVITAWEGTTPEQAVEVLHEHRIEKLPVLKKNSRILVGLFTIKDIQKSKANPDASKDSFGRLLVGAAIGATGDYLDRCAKLLDAGCDVIIVDTAHGHSEGVLRAVSTVREKFKGKKFELIGGNVGTAEATKAMIEAGVDAVKVGIGPGSICTTRVIAGIGVPQFTAVMDCAEAGQKHGIPIVADGGIKYSGDLVKAFAAGAGSCMIGSIFAGTEEAPGDLEIYQGKTYKSYRGMGSISAMTQGSKDRYFQANVEETGKFVPEGVEGRVAYRGSIASTVFQLVGGIRSGMGYIGVPTIEELQKKAQFVKISSAALRESHVHDVFVTREAPNYLTEKT